MFTSGDSENVFVRTLRDVAATLSPGQPVYMLLYAIAIIFFGSYAPKGFHAVTWSVWYNITYIAVEAAITIVVINMPPNMFLPLQ